MAGAQGDGYTKALMTVSYSHHEIHGGDHYLLQGFVDKAINNVVDFRASMPDTEKWIHMLWKQSSENEADWYLYEDAVITVAGTSVIPINNNRNSANTAGMAVDIIENNSLALANSDTDVTGATLLASGKLGSKKTAGGDFRTDSEIVFRQGSIVCYRIVFVAAGWFTYNAEWYEHTHKKKLPNRK